MSQNNRQRDYWQIIESQVPRLFSLMDRRSTMNTFGSFDRKFWHQRFSDFSSASLQQGVEVLAQLYINAPDKSIYKENPNIIKWIEAAVIYTETLQNKDGSFNEWYVGEHGWAGPTSYILNSLYEAYIKTGEYWSAESKEAFLKVFKKSIKFLIHHEEKNILANHQALALLTVYQGYSLFKDDKTLKGYEKLFDRLIASFDQNEGWSLEYDGADPGYQTATLSFLARLHRINSCDKVMSLVEKQLEFISHFVYPSGEMFEGLGSRSTSNVFFFAFEYWSKYFPLAQTLAQISLKSLKENKIISPLTQEDHYLIYRLPELFLAMEFAKPTSSSEVGLPYEKKEYFKHYKKSGYIIIKKQSLYLVIDGRYGGRYRVYSCSSKQLKASCGDIFMKKNGNQTFSSGGITSLEKVSVTNTKIKIHCKVIKISSPVFRPSTFILFKIVFSALSISSKISWLLKMLIRKKLMFTKAVTGIKVKREFDLSEKSLEINSKVEGATRVVATYGQPSRYVPQSNYFSENELNFKEDKFSNNTHKEIVLCVE